MENTHPLRLWRDRNDVTLAALATDVEVTPSHLSEIERGLNRPSIELAARLVRASGKLAKTDGDAVKIEDFVAPEQPAPAQAIP